MEEPIAYKNEHGIWIYRKLPDGMRIAGIKDFINENDEIILGKHFLVKSYYYNRFEAHVTNKSFLSKWEYWLLDDKVFVK